MKPSLALNPCLIALQKLAIHEYIKELGVPYTFIDVGWWAEQLLPKSMHTKGTDRISQEIWRMSHTIVGDGTAPNLVTLVDHIGIYVARIIADPRTINRSVIIWEDEATQLQAQELGERYSGEAEEFRAQRIYVSIKLDALLFHDMSSFTRGS